MPGRDDGDTAPVPDDFDPPASLHVCLVSAKIAIGADRESPHAERNASVLGVPWSRKRAENEPKTRRKPEDWRRRPVSEERRALFGPFVLNTRRGCLTRGNDDVHLRPQTYEVLRYLVENDGRLIGKDELIRTVWQGRAVTDGSLGKCIEEIRDALGPSARLYVRNVRGRGYLFDSTAGVRPEEEPRRAEADGTVVGEELDVLRIAVETEVSGAVRPEVARRRVTAVALAAGAAAALAMLATRLPDAGPSSTAASPAAMPIRSLAVLPFRPTDAAHGDGSLELGMADAAIIRLGVLSGITVRPLSAVRQYTDPAQDSTSIGRDLDVDAVLEGHIQRVDERLRVTARLLQVRDGRQLWADQFEGPVGDLFAVQDVVAERVARALAVELTGEQLQRLAKRYTDNITAYQHYLRGRQHALALTRQDLFAAREAFERAIEADRNYALAYAGLADVYTNLVPRGLIGAAEGRAKAQAVARKALSLDADLPEALAAMGQVLVYAAPYDFEAADRALRRAIQLNHNLAIAHNSSACHCSFKAVSTPRSSSGRSRARSIRCHRASPGCWPTPIF